MHTNARMGTDPRSVNPPQDLSTMTPLQRARYLNRTMKLDANDFSQRDTHTDARKHMDPRSSNPPKDPSTMTPAERDKYYDRKDKKYGIPGQYPRSQKLRKQKQRKANYEARLRRQQS